MLSMPPTSSAYSTSFTVALMQSGRGHAIIPYIVFVACQVLCCVYITVLVTRLMYVMRMGRRYLAAWEIVCFAISKRERFTSLKKGEPDVFSREGAGNSREAFVFSNFPRSAPNFFSPD